MLGPVKTVVLDSTELSSDFMCTGLKLQLVDHMFHETWLSVRVPASVVEETIANHAREASKLHVAARRLSRDRRRLGLEGAVSADDESFDYRSYLIDRFDRLGITVLPWPSVTHEELVARAVRRRPPFDEKGGGYRDSLVWADAVQLAASGCRVALVSSDRAFTGPDSQLASALQDEIADLPGSVELVRNFGAWLVAELPWQAEDLKSAVAVSRDRQFHDYILMSDARDGLLPAVEDLGLRRPPERCEITEAEWDGWFESVSSSLSPDGLRLVEYELGFDVLFEAEYRGAVESEPGWEITEDALRWTQVSGAVPMIARLAVLFGGEFAEFEICDVSWRRADGVGRGESSLVPEGGPHQPTFLDSNVL